jgi:segregation and condensation protein A
MAATLAEIKSRAILPKPPPEESVDVIVDPRLELVRQLLEYKTFKDASRQLQSAAEMHALRHERIPSPPETPPDDIELDSLDIWDLFEAFKRLLEQTGRLGAPHEVTVDDTPLVLHMEDLLDSLERAGGERNFEDVFTGRPRAEMIGLFLALLELIRLRKVRVMQDRPFGEIRIRPLPAEERLRWETLEREQAIESLGGAHRGVLPDSEWSDAEAESDEPLGEPDAWREDDAMMEIPAAETSSETQ